jgi:DNA-binding beta-propeller fold protein YncE
MRSSSLLRRSTIAGVILALASTVFVAAPATAAGPGAESISFTKENTDYWDATPDGTYIVMSGYDDAEVRIINTVANTLTIVDDPLNVVDGPGAVAISPDGLTAYVANYNSATQQVLVIDIATATIVDGFTDPEFTGLWAIALSPSGDRLYLHDYLDNELYVVDPSTGLLIDTVVILPAGDTVWQLHVSPDGSTMYAVYLDGSIDVIDLVSLTVSDSYTDVSLLEGNGSCMSPDGLSLYLPDQDATTFYRVSTATGAIGATNAVTEEDLNSYSYCAVSPDGRSVYLSDSRSAAPGIINEYDAETLAFVAAYEFDAVDFTEQIMFFNACEAYVVGREGNAQTFSIDCAAAPELAATGSPSSPVLGSALLAALLLLLGFGAVAVRSRYSSVRSSQ